MEEKQTKQQEEPVVKQAGQEGRKSRKKRARSRYQKLMPKHKGIGWMILRCIGIVVRTILTFFQVLFMSLFIIGVAGTVTAAGIGFFLIYPIYQDFRSQTEGIVEASTLDTFRLQEASFIYDANGDVLAKLTGDEDSSYLPYDQIPEAAIQAFVAIEDRTFWENPGIDMKGIFRVGINYLRTEGEEKHGASTITQQLARNRFLTREVSIERKVKEMLIAMDLTKKYTKEQIMEFYINDISFANTYYGLEAAARGYFAKHASDLTLSQTAYLCAIPNSPTYYNPYNHPENALKRRDKILADMKEMEFISEAEYQSAIKETITVQRPRMTMRNYETTYAVDCAVRYLMRRDGFPFKYGIQDAEELEQYKKEYEEVYNQERDALYTGGYTLYTSLDPAKQQILQEAVDGVLTFDDKTADNGVYQLQGAATAIDNKTNRVVAIVGGRSQETDTYTLNRAFQSPRQPGSTIKPLIVYAPALENGYTDTTQVRNINVSDAKEKGAVISELPGATMPLRKAVELSRNGVAWYVFDDITPPIGMAYLTQMRFGSIVPDDYFPASALGGFTYGATTEEMAGAYSALAKSGSYREPTCILRLVDKAGNDIFEEYPDIQVYQKSTAVLMTDILKGVIRSGTASSMGWRGEIQAAGKTGTTNGSKDGWFCGMTPYYTISVWVGYDQPKMLSSLYGATYPASIWKGAMEKLVEGLEPASFPEPEDEEEENISEYLPGHESEYPIKSGYTAGDYRRDHELADQALELTEQAKTENYARKKELREQASELVDQIQEAGIKRRTERLISKGKLGSESIVPAETVPVETAPEEVPTETPIIIPAGPGSDTQQPAQPANQAQGPGAEIEQREAQQ